MQVRIDLLNECEVIGLRVFIQVFDVEGEAVISGKCCEEVLQLLAEDDSFCGIFKEVAGGGVEAAGMEVDVIKVRKDFSIFVRLLNDALDLVVLIGVVNGAPLEDRELERSCVVPSRSVEVPSTCNH